MSTIAVGFRKQLDANSVLYQWGVLANGDDGEPVKTFDFADCSVQFNGTPGAGANVVWEGSNVEVPSVASDWFTLTDAQAAAISKAAPFLEQVAEVCLWMRPRVTAGDVTTSWTVRLFCRRGR